MSDQADKFSEFLLGKQYRKQVLQELLRKPDYEYTVNEIADKTVGSYMSVRKFLRNLESFNVVKIRKKGNYSLVELNKDSIYSEVILTVLRSDITPLRTVAEDYSSQIRQRWGDKVDSIYLFGSVAKGCADKNSDIDILILAAQDSQEEIKERASKLAQKMDYGADNVISPLVESKQEFKRNLAEGERFETEVADFGIKLIED